MVNSFFLPIIKPRAIFPPMSEHPLQSYLDKSGEMAYQFADRANLNRQVVYDLLSGKSRKLSIETMTTIEAATEGRVKITDILKWYNRHPPGE